MKNQLPHPVQWAINRLLSCKYEAYAVGGCVRDMLLGRTPHDWDVCTSASPREVIDCFADVRVVATGIKHGTVTAVLDGQPVEITTYRVDGGYTDHRRPDTVAFTASLREDLARRDFTINAMAYRPDTGIIDYYGGQKDLGIGVIRCVGDPDTRFTEDALRMLRALRFASRFDFMIEPKTAESLLSHREELRFVAAERVLHELTGMEFSNIPARYLPVLQVVIPELKALNVRPGLPPDPCIRMAALLRGLDARPIMTRLKASTAMTDRVATLVAEEDMPVADSDVAVRRLLRRIGPEATAQLLALQDDEAGLRRLKTILDRGDAYSLRQLAVNGNDIRKIGLEGRHIGRTLESLLSKVVDGELPNEHYTLLKAVGIAATLTGTLREK